MNILSIGNSYSDDAQFYIKTFCDEAGLDADVANLFIGGCSLETHLSLIRSGEKEYSCHRNGVVAFEPKVSSVEIIKERPWDIITLQQASHDSGRPQTYIPYLAELSAEVHRLCPSAKLVLHETWPYPYNSQHELFPAYHSDTEEMYRRIADCYQMASRLIDAPVIPVGSCFMAVHHQLSAFSGTGISLLYKEDKHHLSYNYGRYLASLVWFAFLLHGDLRSVRFTPSDADPKIAAEIRALLASLLN